MVRPKAPARSRSTGRRSTASSAPPYPPSSPPILHRPCFMRSRPPAPMEVPVLAKLAETQLGTCLFGLIWTRKGGTFRALLVVSVGTITLLALTGSLVFMLFFLSATINAIVISLLVSLVAVGGFVALFFSCLIAIYIGALLVATFVISIMTITTIAAVIVATGWVGFFWTLWLAARKSVDLTKHSLNMTSSAISAYSATRQARRQDSSKSA
ncbi:hypothetical protein QJS10_CPA09g00265 [Acorus calamus]|uniref:Uncharacterized protein n=1 Tax=Acorus calamus TaxID=4465 RepID=A0AAV9E8U4_ACOCL|nr:hypothetical protein QJS10_CPA09g00265 [Acorus calamus]